MDLNSIIEQAKHIKLTSGYINDVDKFIVNLAKEFDLEHKVLFMGMVVNMRRSRKSIPYLIGVQLKLSKEEIINGAQISLNNICAKIHAGDYSMDTLRQLIAILIIAVTYNFILDYKCMDNLNFTFYEIGMWGFLNTALNRFHVSTHSSVESFNVYYKLSDSNERDSAWNDYEFDF